MLTYTQPLTINWLWNYTLKYYSIDTFWNKEPEQTKTFTIVQTPAPSNTGKISGYIFEDSNSNNIKDSNEKTMAWWKLCIDTNNNNTCEENSETFTISNNQWYYEFDSLSVWAYKILEIPHQNWTVLSPTSWDYTVTLTNSQQVTNKNFGNIKSKKK
jgi:hypothetical protein